jgi:predicted transcriptional regulator
MVHRLAYANVRITEATRGRLRSLAEREERSMQAVLEDAVEAYRRQKLLEQVNAAYADLRRDESAWADVQAERAAWDRTLADGLPGDRPAGSRPASSRARRRRR